RDLVLDPSVSVARHRQYSSVLKNVQRMILPTSFFVLRGQVIFWILAAAGRTGTMADVGVMSRLAILLGPLIVSINSIALPRISRLKDPRQLGRVYLMVLLGSVAGMALVLSPVVLFPGAFVWVVGAQYEDLQDNLSLAVFSVALVSGITVMSSLNLSRGWNR